MSSIAAIPPLRAAAPVRRPAVRGGLRHAFADLDDVRLHYVTQGDGPLVVLLHGFPEFWWSWRHQIPALARRHEVVAPDLRGYNESGRPRGIRSYRMDRLVADVVGLVRALGRERAILVGHDWGGAIAWTVAADHPEVVERLVVLNCPHPTVYQAYLRSGVKNLGRIWFHVLFQIPWLPELAVRYATRPFVRFAFRETSIRKENFPDRDLEPYVEMFRRSGWLGPAVDYYRAAFREILVRGERPYRPIRCPTLLVWGEDDYALDPSLAPGARAHVEAPFELEFVSRAAHYVHQEDPARVNERIERFLRAGGP